MYKQLVVWALLALTVAPIATAEQEFLKPHQAFAISAQVVDSDRLLVDWRIADGYYMYQSKFRFRSETAGAQLGDPRLPPAETQNDPIFGEVEVYRNQVRIEVPLDAVPANAETLTLSTRSQGCADAGICYPPHTQRVQVALNRSAANRPVFQAVSAGAGLGPNEESEPISRLAPIDPVTNAQPEDPLAALAAFSDDLGLGTEGDILPAEEAFKVSATSPDGNRLQVQWSIAEGTYLFQDKIRLALNGDGVQLGAVILPEPEIKKNSIKPDGSFGDVAVYYDLIDLEVPLRRSNTEATKAQLTVHYQGCADRGICYPPQSQVFGIDLPAATGASTLADTSVAPRLPGRPTAPAQSEQDRIVSMIAGKGTWFIAGAFFVIGLGLAFTPCVFPMIPILSGIITGQGEQLTTRKAFLLSLVYVLAMAVTYTLAGVFAALAGENLQAMLQNPVAIGGFALVFVALALSMFGFYELQLPSGLQSRLAAVSERQERGSLAGAGIMGLLSALIVGPCITPPLAATLIFIAQTGDAFLGGLALFAMSMGMGAPLIAIGTSAGKLLPRAGAWMDAVKAVFGVLMLAVAIYLLERVVSPVAAMLLWGVLLIVTAVYMGALSQLSADASGWRKLWKGLGLVLLIYGALFLVGVAANGSNTLQPLRGLGFAGHTDAGVQDHTAFKRIKTVADLDRELAAAKAAGRPVMLDFYADWCVYCIQMERDTFPDPRVRQAMRQLVLLQADVTDNDAADKALQRHIGIPAPPAMIFWGADGAERRHLRLLGFMGPEDFAGHLQSALAE